MATENLIELFGNRTFRIPDYQRGYAWSERQLNELWDDIEDITERQGEYAKHYTGTIFIEEMQSSAIKESERWFKSTKFYNVVDGQQRLTTIVILLFELLLVEEAGYNEIKKEELYKQLIATENMSGTNRVYKFGYLNATNEFLQNKIFDDAKIVLPSNYRNAYTQNLEFAKTFFRTKIELLSKEQRDVIYTKLTSSLIFDIRTIEQDLDVQAVFETMNNRGKPLSVLEKLKNRLIYLTEKLNIDKSDKFKLRENINAAWGEIFRCLAQNPDKILNEDEFLSMHLSLCRKPNDWIFSETQTATKVFEMFCNRASSYPMSSDNKEGNEPAVSFDKINEYVISLSALAPLWYNLHNSNSKILRKIFKLNSNREVKLYILSLLKYFNISTIEQIDENKELAYILESIELIIFRNSIPGLWVMDYRNMAHWARDLYLKDKEISLEEINDELLKHTNKEIEINKVISGFSYLFTYVNGSKGFHRWSGLKYFIFEYEEYLKNEYREDNDRVSLYDYDLTTIEHIMPQDCENWQTESNEYIDKFEDDDKGQAKKILVNTLGNLTILKGGKNSSLGKAPWKDKRSRYESGSYNELEISKNQLWNIESINIRGEKMLRFMLSKINKKYKLHEEDMKKILYTEEKYYM